MASLTFLGATGTVTGSKFLVQHGESRVLVDCGLFQGLKELRLRNWGPPPVEPGSLDAAVLTHAHLDHTGYLPLMVRKGFPGPAFATSATCDLCGILLPDSGHLQEEDARFANRKGFSKHRPALPLYTEQEARRSLEVLRPVPFDTTQEVAEGVHVRFRPAGHILGAAIVEMNLRSSNGSREKTIVFSGDLGRPRRPIIPDPSPLPPCDHLLLESTYGNRDHPDEDEKERLIEIILETVRRGGTVLIPSFAVGRTQTLLYILRELQEENRLPTDIPIHVDSPMAIHATRVFINHPEAFDFETRNELVNGEDPLGLHGVHLDSRVEDSKALNNVAYPAIIISASGMVEGGRILHHMEYKLPDHRTTILFVGFQAAGTRGRALLEGAKHIKIHGRQIPVRARIESLENLSAHADRREILSWLGAAKKKPGTIHLVHGEPEATEAMAQSIEERFGTRPHVPLHQEKIKL